MSIWFGWGRSQATPLMTDDEDVEDVSAAPPNVTPQPPRAASFDRLREMTNRVPGAPDPAIAAVFELHERVLEGERKANRFLAKASARREHHEALVAEADALNKLGFQNFEAFAAAHGNTPREVAAAPPAGGGQTVDRIRVLLGELGVDPGEDPLNSAKEFLSRVEGDTAPYAPEVDAAETAAQLRATP